MTTPRRPAASSTRRCNALTLLLAFLGLVAVLMVTMLHRLVHMDVNCSSKDNSQAQQSKCDDKPAAVQQQQQQEAAAATTNDDNNKKNSILPTSFTPPQLTEPWKFDYFGPDASIQSYNPAHNPVYTGAKKKLRTRLFTEVFRNQHVPMNECKHILYDGLVESDWIDLAGTVYTENNKGNGMEWDESWAEDELWVLDSHHVLSSCGLIFEWMEKTRHAKGDDNSWMILAVDYGDAYDQLYQCDEIASHKGYRIAKRSIGMGREWDEVNQFPTKGSIAPQPNTNTTVLHLPYPIRTDVARGIAAALKKGDPFQHERPIHVSHFYARQALVATKAYYDNLRNGINIILKFLHGMPIDDTTFTLLNTFTGLAGKDRKMGRNVVSSDYVDKMLQSQIIIVAQRDGWSDHYRLMEALSSGAMVICDETLILPRGLRHGESVVTFQNLQELRSVLYYFVGHTEERNRIAKRGWEIGMGYHRSWHAMESVIFGTPQTDPGNPQAALARDLKERPEEPPTGKAAFHKQRKGGRGK